MISPHPLFTRKLSFNTLIDLSEKCEFPSTLPRAGLTTPLRIAIIGAGITGISTACQIIDAGFDCQIFEAGDESNIGGIWTKVNETSSLQVHSSFYRFHPAVEWKCDYPQQGEILGQIRKLWQMYGLSSKATFNCKVNSTYQEGGKWVVNDRSNGYFDGLMCAVGMCGEANSPSFEYEKIYTGDIRHSSDLSRRDIEGKRVLIIGGGASAAESLEFACDNGAASVKVLARSEKWFLPRLPWLTACMATIYPDRFSILAWIIQFLLRTLFYGDLWEMAPSFNSSAGIFSQTPICNSRVFKLIREGRASWLRGDVLHYTPYGVAFSRRAPGVEQGGPGQVCVEEGDVIIHATGYKRPSLSFLPKNKTNSAYSGPNWFLQCFSTEDTSICGTNCTLREGIGSIGGAHICIYARFLLVFLLDPNTRPSTWMMQRSVDLIGLFKAPLPGGPLSFFTMGELYFYFISFLLFMPSMWPYLGFILLGNGSIAGGPELENGVRIPAALPLTSRR